MKLFLLSAAFVSGIGFAGIFHLQSQASSIINSSRLETLGRFCDEGDDIACSILVKETKGMCAGPTGSGCFYDSWRID